MACFYCVNIMDGTLSVKSVLDLSFKGKENYGMTLNKVFQLVTGRCKEQRKGLMINLIDR